MFLFGVLVGALALYALIIKRVMSNNGFDKSNASNPMRVVHHVILHGEDFGKMYYLSDDQVVYLDRLDAPSHPAPFRPFWYISEDEFDGVVKTRP